MPNLAEAGRIIRKTKGGSAEVYIGYATSPIGTPRDNIFQGNINSFVGDDSGTIEHALPVGAVIPPGTRLTYIKSGSRFYLVQPFVSTIRGELTGNTLPEGFGIGSSETGNATSLSRVLFGAHFNASKVPTGGTYSINIYDTPITVQINHPQNKTELEQINEGLATKGFSLDFNIVPSVANGLKADGGLRVSITITKDFINYIAIHNPDITLNAANLTWSGAAGVVSKTLNPSFAFASVSLINPFGTKAFGEGAIVIANWAGDNWYITSGDCSPIFEETP